jgi:hypothetical protein
MDWNVQRRYQCMRWLPVLLAPHVVSAAPHWMMILAWMLTGGYASAGDCWNDAR